MLPEVADLPAPAARRLGIAAAVDSTFATTITASWIWGADVVVHSQQKVPWQVTLMFCWA